MGRFGPRGGCLGVHHGAGLSGHTSPLPQQPPPLLEGWVSPAHGSHLVPMPCPTWGGTSCTGGCPFSPEVPDRLTLSLSHASLEAAGMGQNSSGALLGAGQEFAPHWQHLCLRICPGSAWHWICCPVVLGAQVATAPWLGSWPGPRPGCAQHSPQGGREVYNSSVVLATEYQPSNHWPLPQCVTPAITGPCHSVPAQQWSGPWHRVSPQQSLVLGAVCQPNNGLVLSTECQPSNHWSLAQPVSPVITPLSCQQLLLLQRLCTELLRDKQLLQHVLFPTIAFRK